MAGVDFPDALDDKHFHRRGLAALGEIAEHLGLPMSDPEILSDRGNLVVWLRPTPVVARVCTMTAFTRRDPAVWLEREVRVASAVVAAGGPVVAPAAGIDPGPHAAQGFGVTFWTWAPIGSRQPTAEQAGRSLAELHDALDTVSVTLPVLTPARDQITEGLAALVAVGALASSKLDQLSARHHQILDAVAAQGSPPRVLHGDAHPGNLIDVDGRWCWIDLEETCVGPAEWDLVCLSRSRRLDGAAAVRSYCAARGIAVPSPEWLAPLTQARQLEAAVWALGMAHQDPERYRSLADQLLAEFLESDLR